MNKVTEKILKEQDDMMTRMKTDVIESLRKMDKAAILWGANVFGATSYPLISDTDGRTHEVSGLALTGSGQLGAVIDLPGSAAITGVRALDRRTMADGLKNAHIVTDGTPEEWEILCDCYDVASQVLKAGSLEHSPQPWW